jgi:TolB-like protein/lipoprotein NlpI
MPKKLLKEIKSRKIPKWITIHLSTSLTIIGAINLIGSKYNFPPEIFDIAVIIALCGLPITLVFVWYHASHQNIKFKSGEIIFYAAICVIMFFLIINILFLSSENVVYVEEKSIAVLPFKNFSDSKEDEYFSDGVTEDILTQLSNVHSLKVISRTSVMKYKDSKKNIKEIAKELGVESILEGSIRRSNGRVRIVGQLIDAQSDKHIWAETYDREIKDIFEIQSEVAKKITDALMVTLTKNEKDRIEKRHTNSIDAYTYYLKGREYLNRLTPDDVDVAVGFFKKALAIDSNYSLAYAGLGEAYAQKFRAFSMGDEWSDSSRLMSEKAINLDPDIAEPHIALGLNLFYSGKLRLALKQYLKAVELNPNSIAVVDVGQVYYLLGNYVEAIPWLKKAIGIDPTRWMGYRNLGFTYYSLGRFDEAEKLFFKVLELMPEHTYVLKDLTELYIVTKQYEKADSLLLNILKKDPENLRVLFCLGEVRMFEGDLSEAKKYIQKVISITAVEYGPAIEYGFVLFKEKKYKDAQKIFDMLIKIDESEINKGMENHNYPYELARIYSILNKKDQTIDALKIAIMNGWKYYLFTMADPLLENIKSDSRFKFLMNNLKNDLDQMKKKIMESKN